MNKGHLIDRSNGKSPLSARVTPLSQASDRFRFCSNFFQEKPMGIRTLEIDSTLGTISTKGFTNMKSCQLAALLRRRKSDR